MWGDESEAVATIIWLYQIVDAQKEEVFFPELLITLRSYACIIITIIIIIPLIVSKAFIWTHWARDVAPCLVWLHYLPIFLLYLALVLPTTWCYILI